MLELHTLLAELLDHDTVFEDFVVTGDFADMGEITVLVNARRIVNVHDNTKLILMAFETIALQTI